MALQTVDRSPCRWALYSPWPYNLMESRPVRLLQRHESSLGWKMIRTGILRWRMWRLAVVRCRWGLHYHGTTTKSTRSLTSSDAYRRGVRQYNISLTLIQLLTLIDPNYPEDKRESKILDSSTIDDDVFSIKELEDSPYPEVRAAVRNYDEDVPANTIRAWTIGLMLVFLGASMNTLFSLRNPAISLGPLVAQIIAWPLGHGYVQVLAEISSLAYHTPTRGKLTFHRWAKVMPRRKFTTFGLKWSLNPGPFNIKEHSIIVVMAGVSFSAAYATDIILAQVAFYNQNFGILFQLLLTISTQSIGYGISGMMRKFLV